jgi:hypothetical protein
MGGSNPRLWQVGIMPGPGVTATISRLRPGAWLWPMASSAARTDSTSKAPVSENPPTGKREKILGEIVTKRIEVQRWPERSLKKYNGREGDPAIWRKEKLV